MAKEFAANLRALLDQAQTALSGDAADGERRAKAVSALVRAERDVAEFLNAPQTTSPEEDEEVCRAELRRRIALFIEADLADAPPDVLARIARTGVA